MVNNYICEDCDHNKICANSKKIFQFHEDAKKDLQINITVDSCENFKEIQENK